MRFSLSARDGLRQVSDLITLAAFVVVCTTGLLACSDGSASNPASTAPNTTLLQGNSSSAADMTATSWCTQIINPSSGVRDLERVCFSGDGTLNVTRFHLTSNQTRGAQFGSDNGHWQLNGENLSATLQASATEGARQLQASVRVRKMSDRTELRVTLKGSQGFIAYLPCE